MSTATRATGSRSLTAWSLGPFTTVPSYQNRGSDHACVGGEVATETGPDHDDVTLPWSGPHATWLTGSHDCMGGRHSPLPSLWHRWYPDGKAWMPFSCCWRSE